MAILVHRYDSPDRFVAGTVGQPGERTFFLQAREGNRITSVVVEKQQVSVLAEHLDKVLDEVLRRSGPAADVPPAREKPSDFDPLDAPITEEFRVGTMTIAWDAEINKIVIVPTRNSSVIGASSGSKSLGFSRAGGTSAAGPLRRSTSSRTLSRCSASTETCCFSTTTDVMRFPSRACRKNVRSPGWPTVPATNRSGES